MTKVECEVECTVRNAAGEAFVRVRQLYAESWYFGEGASLDGCPLVPVTPWKENASPLTRTFGMFVYDFHLSRPDDIGRFSPGMKVIFRPGIPRFGR